MVNELNFAPKQAKGKNIGRANETTPEEQALFEAYSLWLKKQDQGYRSDEKGSAKSMLPMLANKYEERGEKYLEIPFAVSRKLDGIRMMAYHCEDELILSSRLGKPFQFLHRIREQLHTLLPRGIAFDGELYSHTLPFQVISGAVRTKKTPSKHDALIEYWIFDIATREKISYKDRMKLLRGFEKQYKKTTSFKERVLKFLYYETIDDHVQVQDYHDTYVKEGIRGYYVSKPEFLLQVQAQKQRPFKIQKLYG